MPGASRCLPVMGHSVNLQGTAGSFPLSCRSILSAHRGAATNRHGDSDDEHVDGGGGRETVLTEREIEGALEASGEERDEEGDRERRHERRQQAHPNPEPRLPSPYGEQRPEPRARQG